ncbi:MAG: phenylalanine--tRNA ligase subunit beta [Arsenophonus endosymbiont of Ceratovacuna japonica]
MKVSEFWLREWVNPKISSEDLSEQMTMAGLEINNIKIIHTQCKGILVGEIIKCIKHPNIDKLQLIKVDIGAKHLLNIICEASNCRKGLKVAVAIIGSILPNNFKIKAIKLEGKISEGILCSYSELAIPNDHIGIIELPCNAYIGSDINNYLNLNDHIFEINFTSNRADCLSILGIARDIAAINNLKLNMINIKSIKSTDTTIFPISVKEPKACPRFLARIIKGINITNKIPNYIINKLTQGGINSINPIIDITNFVLLELGQPLNSYDLDNLNGSIIVRMSKQNEVLVLLDGSKIYLQKDTLVIADNKNTIGIAGIFNGKYSSVNQYTKNIILESAFFNPLSIAGIAHKYGIYTESSRRFEKGVDPQIQYKAIERATKLIIEICGGEVGNIIDISQKTYLPKVKKITLTRKKLDLLIGHHIPYINVTKILINLGFEVINEKNNWQIITPSWRFDIQIEEDLIEEVVRIYGYNNIPNTLLNNDLIINQSCESILPLKRVKTLLVDRNYNEIITYSFVDPKIQKLLYPNYNAIILHNPISSDMSEMRLSLLPGLLKTIIYNQNRQQNNMRLFETGLRFIPDISVEYGVRQELMIAGVITGNRYKEHWSQEKRTVDFFDIKGDVEAILKLTGKLDNIIYKNNSYFALHPGQSAMIYLNDNYIGYIGAIHPKIKNNLDLNGQILVFELIWDIIKERIIPKANIISRFPSNRRDISIVISEEISTYDILCECKKIDINHIVEINLFDVYYGKGIKKGYKSLAISLTLQDVNRTLEEEEITAIIDKCVTALNRRFQAYLRN